VGWKEAAALGIDNFEHGPVYTDTEFAVGKQPDACPSGSSSRDFWIRADIAGPEVQGLIQELVARRVAITSTLPVFELGVPGRPPLQQKVLDAMSAESRASYLAARGQVRVTPENPAERLLRKEMAFELAFARAGGLLLAGPDPTGSGGALPGFGDQRQMELLVVKGDPSTRIEDIEQVELVFKNGLGYDPAKLIESVRGHVGIR
jgi:hypothetical protein